MPVLVIAIVFLVIFGVMGVILFRAMAKEHKGQLFTAHWADRPKGK